jgi:hypothetical protein
MSQRKDRKRVHRNQVKELGHPVRLRILELVRADPQRSLTTAALVPDMDDLEVNHSQVAYHVMRLREAKLLPGRA